MTHTVDRLDVPTAARWEARGAVACALAAVVLLIAADARSVGVVLIGAAGAIVLFVGVWMFLAHRGLLRWTGAAVAVAAPVAVLALYAYRGTILGVVLVVALLLATAALSLQALRSAAGTGSTSPAEERAATRPRNPHLIMNPRSGGGKVVRFELVAKARALGADVTVLEGPGHIDVTEWARKAVANGADLLGVAGGDGTQALVAGVAAENHVPFLVLSAGTRNHFAMDLGLDRADPAAGLAALDDGVELCIDLGDINGRTFVNNASFGAYAEIVQSPAYRDDKRGTTLDLLPDLLGGNRAPHVVAHIDHTVSIEAPSALLISNNVYAGQDIAGLGRRYRLDGGELGVVSVTVNSAARAAGLIGGLRSKGLSVSSAHEVVVEADAAEIPVGIDGESVMVRTPVRCSIRPAALHVRVPRQRPGSGPPPVALHPVTVLRLAVGRG